MTSSRRVRGEEGITLVELLTAMTVSAVALAVITGTVIQALSTQRLQTAQIVALNDGKLAFERTTRDIRGADPLRVAAADRIELDVLDRTGSRRTVSYQRVGDGLVFTDAASGQPRILVAGLAPAQPIFLYHLLDGSTATGAAAVDAGSVYAITVRLQVETARAGRVLDLESRVFLRNAS